MALGAAERPVYARQLALLLTEKSSRRGNNDGKAGKETESGATGTGNVDAIYQAWKTDITERSSMEEKPLITINISSSSGYLLPSICAETFSAYAARLLPSKAGKRQMYRSLMDHNSVMQIQSCLSEALYSYEEACILKDAHRFVKDLTAEYTIQMHECIRKLLMTPLRCFLNRTSKHSVVYTDSEELNDAQNNVEQLSAAAATLLSKCKTAGKTLNEMERLFAHIAAKEAVINNSHMEFLDNAIKCLYHEKLANVGYVANYFSIKLEECFVVSVSKFINECLVRLASETRPLPADAARSPFAGYISKIEGIFDLTLTETADLQPGIDTVRARFFYLVKFSLTDLLRKPALLPRDTDSAASLLEPAYFDSILDYIEPSVISKLFDAFEQSLDRVEMYRKAMRRYMNIPRLEPSFFLRLVEKDIDSLGQIINQIISVIQYLSQQRAVERLGLARLQSLLSHKPCCRK